MITLTEIRRVIEQAPLDAPLFWYRNESGGVLFPLHACSGGISANALAVLLDETYLPYPDGIDLGRHGLGPSGWMLQLNPYITGSWYVLEFSPFQDSVSDVEERVRTAIETMVKPRTVEAHS